MTSEGPGKSSSVRNSKGQEDLLMIDLANESLISLGQAAAILPPGRQGKKTHFGAIQTQQTSGG
jgi:hypothetical protein